VVVQANQVLEVQRLVQVHQVKVMQERLVLMSAVNLMVVAVVAVLVVQVL
jgi:hypothetical protein